MSSVGITSPSPACCWPWRRCFLFSTCSSNASDSAPHRTKLDQLMERRDAIYDNLRDLRFEYRAGKYSEKDYDEIKQSLEIEAARVLADMDYADRRHSHSGHAPGGHRERCDNS